MEKDLSKHCQWALKNDVLHQFHDKEWGKAVHDDQLLFEHLILAIFEGGLSLTVALNKRIPMRKAFIGLGPGAIAKFGEKDIARLMADETIIRYKAKIKATINNAARFLEVQKEFGTFDNYIWGFNSGKPVINSPKNDNEVAVKSALSDKICADMKKRGFSYVGTVSIYVMLQNAGLVDDHVISCPFKTKK